MRRTGGVALASVLLIVALATAIAYQLASRHSLNLAANRLALDGGQACEYALGGEQYARQLLAADWQEAEEASVDTLLEDWAAADDATAVLALDDGTLRLRIEDLAGRFNLNSLGPGRADNLIRLERLLTHVGVDAGGAAAWLDWIDEDQDVAGGAEDGETLLRVPPHRTADQPGAHVSEFRLATGLSVADFERLRPHIAVLPTATLRVNVNTATAPALAALAATLPLGAAQSLVAEPREFASVPAATALHPALAEGAAALAVGSEYFAVRALAEVGESRCELTATLHRERGTGALTVLSRSYGEQHAWPAPAAAAGG